MAGSGRKNADDALLTPLAGGATVRQVAEAVGISERTIFRRLADPAFRQRVTEARTAMVQQALGKLASNMGAAAETLRQLLTASADNVKLGAARSLLELTVKLRETVELEERLADLERAIAEKERGHV